MSVPSVCAADIMYSRKERECADLEKQLNVANQNLQVVQAELTNSRNQFYKKREELKGQILSHFSCHTMAHNPGRIGIADLERKLQNGLSDYPEDNVEDAIEAINAEINTATS